MIGLKWIRSNPHRPRASATTTAASISSATTPCTPGPTRRRWPSRASSSCTTPCSTTSCSDGSTARSTSRSTSTTAASGCAAPPPSSGSAAGAPQSTKTSFRYPLLKRVADAAEKLIVHNPGAARLAREARADAEIVEIPHYVDLPLSRSRRIVEPKRAVSWEWPRASCWSRASATSGPPSGCARCCWRPAASRRRSRRWSAATSSRATTRPRSAICWNRPESSVCPTSPPSASPNWEPPPTSASICVGRRRARRPGSP